MHELFRVSATSEPKTVAKVMANAIREGKRIELRAIGAAAVNQAVKSIAIARGYVAPNDIDLVCHPYFKDVDVGGVERTSIQFVMTPA